MQERVPVIFAVIGAEGYMTHDIHDDWTLQHTSLVLDSQFSFGTHGTSVPCLKFSWFCQCVIFTYCCKYTKKSKRQPPLLFDPPTVQSPFTHHMEERNEHTELLWPEVTGFLGGWRGPHFLPNILWTSRCNILQSACTPKAASNFC